MRTAKKRTRKANKNARVQTRRIYDVVETTTERRDHATLFILAETLKRGSGESRVFLYPRDNEFGPVVLNGHEARTLYTVLQRHFRETGRSF